VVRLGLDNPRLLAGVAGTAIFVLSRSTIGTIVGGMAAFWVLRFGFGL
jgi:branched-subunit amino acid transport protein